MWFGGLFTDRTRPAVQFRVHVLEMSGETAAERRYLPLNLGFSRSHPAANREQNSSTAVYLHCHYLPLFITAPQTENSCVQSCYSLGDKWIQIGVGSSSGHGKPISSRAWLLLFPVVSRRPFPQWALQHTAPSGNSRRDFICQKDPACSGLWKFAHKAGGLIRCNEVYMWPMELFCVIVC